jgi:hypothetical protein
MSKVIAMFLLFLYKHSSLFRVAIGDDKNRFSGTDDWLPERPDYNEAFFSSRCLQINIFLPPTTNLEKLTTLQISDEFLTNFFCISYKFLMNFLHISNKFHTNFLQISYKFLTNFLQISCKFLTNSLQISYKFLTYFLRIS